MLFFPTLQIFWCCLCSWIVILSYINFSDVVCVAGLWFYPTLQFFLCCLCSWIVILSYITVFRMLFVLQDCDFILHYSFSDVVCVAWLRLYPTLQLFWCFCRCIVLLTCITGFLMLLCRWIVILSYITFYLCYLCCWIVILSYIRVILMFV